MRRPEKTVSFRASADKVDALDALASSKDRPRSYLINEAITNYIELHEYQDSLVRRGLEDLKHGRLISHDEVVKRFQRKRRAKR